MDVMMTFRLGKNDADLHERLVNEKDRSGTIRRALRTHYGLVSSKPLQEAEKPNKEQPKLPKIYVGRINKS